MYRLKINQEGNNFILVEGSNLEEVKRTANTYLRLSGVPEVTRVIYEQVWQEIGEPKYEPSSYSCRACGSYSQDRIKKLEEALRKYADPEHHIYIVNGKAWEVFDTGDGVDEQAFGTWAKEALNG